jgi:hypothetical protein
MSNREKSRECTYSNKAKNYRSKDNIPTELDMPVPKPSYLAYSEGMTAKSDAPTSLCLFLLESHFSSIFLYLILFSLIKDQNIVEYFSK